MYLRHSMSIIVYLKHIQSTGDENAIQNTDAQITLAVCEAPKNKLKIWICAHVEEFVLK